MGSTRVSRPTVSVLDELPMSLVGSWAEKKYDLFWTYAGMFTSAMQGKWERLFYLDLFSGPGRSRIRYTNRILLASPLLALELPTGFDQYIFCETNKKFATALDQRLQTCYPESVCSVVVGDVNERIGDVVAELPDFGPHQRVLGFCFVDPYSLKNIRFSTVRTLADSRYMDFLALIPTGYDATRNEALDLDEDDSTIAEFLGRDEWRDEWMEACRMGVTFDVFMANSFGQSMEDLGFIYPGIDRTQLVRLPEKNVRLYRLVLFSRHKLGEKFWDEARAVCDPQLEFDY